MSDLVMIKKGAISRKVKESEVSAWAGRGFVRAEQPKSEPEKPAGGQARQPQAQQYRGPKESAGE